MSMINCRYPLGFVCRKTSISIFGQKSMRTLLTAIFLLLVSTVFAQNYTKEQTIKYINEKMKIADPVFDNFKLGENGEAVIIWVNNGFWTEYRFNIREIEVSQKVSGTGDNFITFVCVPGVNNCLQVATRQDVSLVGERVDPIKNVKSLDLINIAGFDNVVSLKNAFTYLKILSDKDNMNAQSTKRDPFLYR